MATRNMDDSRIMNNLYARSVFFVKDAEASLRFYTEQLGFSVDWKSPQESPTFVLQVSLFGFELILNQIDERTQNRAGTGESISASRTIKSSRYANTLQKRASKPSVSIGGNRRWWSETWTPTSCSSGIGRTKERI